MKQTFSITLAYLIGLAFVVSGVWVTAAGVKNLARAIDSRSWPTVQGRVVDAGLDSLYNTQEEQYSYQGRIVYEYQFAGRRWRSDRVSFDQGYTRMRGGSATSRPAEYGGQNGPEFAPGAAVVVHVNPVKPQVAVLRPGAGAMLYVAIVLGVIAALAGLFVLRGVLHDHGVLRARAQRDAG
jgi:hypothetical protein